MARPSKYLLLAAVVTALCTGIGVASAAPPADTLVTVGSPPTPFSQNKQNEPTVTIDPANPNVVVAGSNDNIDMESCAAGAQNT